LTLGFLTINPIEVPDIDIGIRTQVPLRFVIYHSKVSETDEKNVLNQ
jgi:hypothetical protein